MQIGGQQNHQGKTRIIEHLSAGKKQNDEAVRNKLEQIITK